jgi:AraC-like DNA-binding protein
MFVHSSRILRQVEHLKSRGINPKPAIEIAEIKEEDIQNPEKMFSFEQFHRVLKYAIEKTGDEFYGLKMGQEPHIAGTIGMMCASCKNLEEAFEQGCKFFKVQGDFADIFFIEDEHYPKIQYNITNAWQLKYSETARHEAEAMFSFLNRILEVNSDQTIKPYKVCFRHKKANDSNFYKEIFGVEPLFEQEANEMFFYKIDLLVPMKAFNPETKELLKSHISSQLKKIKNEETMTEKVKSILLSSMQYHFPDIEDVAKKLFISARTLQRQLSSENTSFKVILQETRFDLAKELLKQQDLTVSEISLILGYSDIGNFSRSFKKVTGKSPQEFKSKS